ncbi:peptide deformylase [Mycoplasmopsis gallinarum]|uniref:Peptide deformylase n=1 Tax=Mycoplasmopsis gallinarum TaxID=29557 RepID=A0A168RJL0_9BACT|nr:peptide deformylase [Mycoplasmopsis gallinarum]OAB49044.1 Peptide deformylase [Mycoplasmopsis gallinarum]
MKYKVNLVKLPNKILRERSKEVELPLSQENIELAEKMIWHIDDSQFNPQTIFQPGVGVAAIQYGIPKRMFYINAEENGKVLRDVLINPKIISTSAAEVALENGEGCLSVAHSWKNQEGFVHRQNRVLAEAYSYFDKKVKTYDLSGYLAIVFQHEYDHLEGKLFIDRINKNDPWAEHKDAKYIG